MPFDGQTKNPNVQILPAGVKRIVHVDVRAGHYVIREASKLEDEMGLVATSVKFSAGRLMQSESRHGLPLTGTKHYFETTGELVCEGLRKERVRTGC